VRKERERKVKGEENGDKKKREGRRGILNCCSLPEIRPWLCH